MMPCYSAMDRKGLKLWPAGGVFTSTRRDQAIIPIFRLGDEEPDSNGGRRRRLGINESLSRAIRTSMFAAYPDLSSNYSSGSEQSEFCRSRSALYEFSWHKAPRNYLNEAQCRRIWNC